MNGRTIGGNYTGGDYYPTVRAWLAKLGARELDIRAHAMPVDEAAARIYIAAVTPRTELRIRALHGSLGRGCARYITLNREALAAGRITLGTVLHECAHAIADQRWRDARRIRTANRVKRVKSAGARRHAYEWRAPEAAPHHGEVFCRIYARLLREVLL